MLTFQCVPKEIRAVQDRIGLLWTKMPDVTTAFLKISLHFVMLYDTIQR